MFRIIIGFGFETVTQEIKYKVAVIDAISETLRVCCVSQTLVKELG